MVTVLEEDKFKLYMRSDADIQLCEGEKLFSEFEQSNNSVLSSGMHI